MTKTIITSYTTLLCMALMMAGAATVRASEVTGTLSSNSSDNLPTSGSISGTVSGESDGNSGGGSRSGGSNGNSSSRPSGSVLGASTDTIQTPGFPNAGTQFEVSAADQTLWSTIKNFFRNIFSL
jgi:hypothetical protein